MEVLNLLNKLKIIYNIHKLNKNIPYNTPIQQTKIFITIYNLNLYILYMDIKISILPKPLEL